MSAQNCQERTNHHGSERTKQLTGSPQVDGDNQGNDGFFPKVEGSGPVKRAREEYEERRHKMARKRTEAASDRTEAVEVEDLLPPSYMLLDKTPDTEGARLKFEAKHQDDGELAYVLPTITNRELVKKVLHEFEDNGAKREGMYVHGLRGIGKSYSLAYLVHHLRGQPEKYRVTYVHDCLLWVKQGHAAWSYILDEILFTFALDTFPPDSKVHDCCAKMQDVSGSTDPSRNEMIQIFFDGLVGALKRWVRSQNLLWVAVFDQVNALESFKKEKKELPATCSWVESAVEPGTFVTVVSASATNESIRTYKDLRQLNVGVDLARLSDKETRYIVGQQFSGEVSEDDIEHLSYRTGKMPWNVVSVLKAPGNNLRKMVHSWERGYADAVMTAHEEYREYLGRLKIANPEAYGKSPLKQLEHYVGCAVLRVPLGNEVHKKYMDQRYMYISQEASHLQQEGWDVASPAFCDFCDPVAREAIVNKLEKPVNVFAMVARPLLARLDLSSTIKGAVIEGYILERLRMDQKVNFTIHQCNWVHNEEKREVEKNGKTETVKIDSAKVVCIPIHSSLPEGDIPGGWIYYIPISKTYKGCDLVIVNKSQQCAYAIQITTKIESHKWTWWDKDKSKNAAERPHASPFDKWREHLGFDPQLVWLCPCLPRVDSPSNKWCTTSDNKGCHPNDHYFILLKDLEMEFEALTAYQEEGV